MKSSQFLIEVKKAIATPEAWCKEEMSQDRMGQTRYLTDPRACKFCMSGALLRTRKSFELPITQGKVMHNFHLQDTYIEARQAILDRLSGEAIPTFNDRSTHAEVIAVIDDAIRDLQIRETVGDI